MAEFLGYRPNKYTLVLTRGAAFTQRFDVLGDPIPDGTTSWIDIYDHDDQLLATWNATTVTRTTVEYLIEPAHTDMIAIRTRATYGLYLNYPGSHLPYCWFRGPVLREQ
ncbi:LtfC-like domain-containing protein [Nocardia amamiensis]|uniref:LtfC-like domain-containing protein n=1 Tax=Nocardia amamiensis TaxID=404578 RepID=UPI0034088E16